MQRENHSPATPANIEREAGPSVLPEVPAVPAGEGITTARRATPRLKFLDGLRGLAAFYVVMNIVTDVVALLATPRRRIAR